MANLCVVHINFSGASDVPMKTILEEAAEVARLHVYSGDMSLNESSICLPVADNPDGLISDLYGLSGKYPDTIMTFLAAEEGEGYYSYIELKDGEAVTELYETADGAVYYSHLEFAYLLCRAGKRYQVELLGMCDSFHGEECINEDEWDRFGGDVAAQIIRGLTPTDLSVDDPEFVGKLYEVCGLREFSRPIMADLIHDQVVPDAATAQDYLVNEFLDDKSDEEMDEMFERAYEALKGYAHA